MEIKAMDDLMAQLRMLSGSVKAGASGAAPTNPAAGSGVAKADFGNVLRSALDSVNGEQTKAMGLAKGYELGAPNVGLHDVAIALQKSNIAFQGAVQVRNKLVSAYHDIMNMQI